jgi:hypothetical protein
MESECEQLTKPRSEDGSESVYNLLGNKIANLGYEMKNRNRQAEESQIAKKHK